MHILFELLMTVKDTHINKIQCIECGFPCQFLVKSVHAICCGQKVFSGGCRSPFCGCQKCIGQLCSKPNSNGTLRSVFCRDVTLIFISDNGTKCSG